MCRNVPVHIKIELIFNIVALSNQFDSSNQNLEYV